MMTLIDAINMDHPFRRTSWTHGDWVLKNGSDDAYGGGDFIYKSNGARFSFIYVDDIMAKDYEILEPEK